MKTAEGDKSVPITWAYNHHFELKGWAEPKIIVRFWIISIVLSLIALLSLKIK